MIQQRSFIDKLVILGVVPLDKRLLYTETVNARQGQDLNYASISLIIDYNNVIMDKVSECLKFIDNIRGMLAPDNKAMQDSISEKEQAIMTAKNSPSQLIQLSNELRTMEKKIES